MSGKSALLVCDGTMLLDGCTESETRLCNRFAHALVRSAASVIARERPAALYLFRPDEHDDAVISDQGVSELLHVYRRELGRFDVVVDAVGRQNGRIALLVWRRRLVSDVLEDARVRRFLASLGYRHLDTESLMHQLKGRLGSYYEAREQGAQHASFPHEVGLVLGYPLDDVVGFMEGGCETCHGRWRCYGDAHAARRRFAHLARVEQTCLERYRAGCQLRELFPEASRKHS